MARNPAGDTRRQVPPDLDDAGQSALREQPSGDSSVSVTGVSLKDALSFAKSAAEGIPLLVAITYVVGFLVVYTDLLTHYDFTDYSVVQGRYLYVGAWIVLQLCVVFCFTWFLWSMTTQLQDLSGGSRLVRLAVASVVVLAMYNVSIKLIMGTVSGGRLVETGYVRFRMSVWLLVTVVFCWNLIRLKGVGLDRAWIRFQFSYLILVWPLVLLLSYAMFVYPVVPRSMGGGQPTMIRLQIKPTSIVQLKDILGLDNNGLSKQVYLVEQRANEYGVLIKNSEGQFDSVEIQTSEVLAIYHDHAIAAMISKPIGRDLKPGTNVPTPFLRASPVSTIVPAASTRVMPTQPMPVESTSVHSGPP